MFHQNQLNVNVKLPMKVDFSSIPGVIKAIQVFPGDPEMENLYIVYVEAGSLQSVEVLLDANDGIESVERIPVRTLV